MLIVSGLSCAYVQCRMTLGAAPLPHLLCSHLQNVAAKRIHMTSIPYTAMNLGIAGVMLRQGLISNLTRSVRFHQTRLNGERTKGRAHRSRTGRQSAQSALRPRVRAWPWELTGAEATAISAGGLA